MKERKWGQTFAYCRIMSRLSLGLNYLSWLTLLFNRSTTFFLPNSRASLRSKVKRTHRLFSFLKLATMWMSAHLSYLHQQTARGLSFAPYLSASQLNALLCSFRSKIQESLHKRKRAEGKCLCFARKYFSSRFLPGNISLPSFCRKIFLTTFCPGIFVTGSFTEVW